MTPASLVPERRLVGRVAVASKKKHPRGGHGGSVEIIGGPAVAEGGNGGRGGAVGHGRGGDGGGGTHYGAGYARGGDGGDAGRPARPALGAVSTMCYTGPGFLGLPGVTNIYGIPQPGKGGDSHTAYVIHEGRKYCLNILLQLLRGPVPKIVENLEVIDAVDALGLERGIKTEQEWWDLAVEMFPEETGKVMEHMRICEKL